MPVATRCFEQPTAGKSSKIPKRENDRPPETCGSPALDNSGQEHCRLTQALAQEKQKNKHDAHVEQGRWRLEHGVLILQQVHCFTLLHDEMDGRVAKQIKCSVGQCGGTPQPSQGWQRQGAVAQPPAIASKNRGELALQWPYRPTTQRAGEAVVHTLARRIRKTCQQGCVVTLCNLIHNRHKPLARCSCTAAGKGSALATRVA